MNIKCGMQKSQTMNLEIIIFQTGVAKYWILLVCVHSQCD